MVTIIKTEFMKLKRYFIVWIGVSLMLLTVLLTLFTTMADDGMVWDYQFLFEQVVKHFVTMIFPMCITLISGYMISREYTDDTLKNIETFSQIWHNIGSNGSYIPFIGLGFDSITSHILHPLIYILSKRFIGACPLWFLFMMS